MVCYLKHKAGTSLPFLMVGVAQLVRAPGCGPGGRGFDPLHSPHLHQGAAWRRAFQYSPG